MKMIRRLVMALIILTLIAPSWIRVPAAMGGTACEAMSNLSAPPVSRADSAHHSMNSQAGKDSPCGQPDDCRCHLQAYPGSQPWFQAAQVRQTKLDHTDLLLVARPRVANRFDSGHRSRSLDSIRYGPPVLLQTTTLLI